MADRSLVEEWLKKADSDYAFALYALEAPMFPFFEQACFLFQQSSEKYLKACVVAHDLPFRKIHDLRVLLESIEKKFPEFSSLRNHCSFLTAFYVEVRYPEYPETYISKETALKAKDAASHIRDFVKNFLHR